MSAIGPEPAAGRLIVALDVAAIDEAKKLMGALRGVVRRFKVGWELFCSAGPAAVRAVTAAGGEVFLDLKFHDIPATVAGAAAAAARHGAFMINVHASGGRRMMEAAVAAAREAAAPREAAARRARPPLVIAVTLLTSLSENELKAELGLHVPPAEAAVRLARLAQAAGCDGVVASPREAAAVRAACGPAFIIVCPGVRPAGSDTADQRRTATPAEAVAAGADYIVVGRPVTRAPDPAAAARAIIEEMEREMGVRAG